MTFPLEQEENGMLALVLWVFFLVNVLKIVSKGLQSKSYSKISGRIIANKDNYLKVTL